MPLSSNLAPSCTGIASFVDLINYANSNPGRLNDLDYQGMPVGEYSFTAYESFEVGVPHPESWFGLHSAVPRHWARIEWQSFGDWLTDGGFFTSGIVVEFSADGSSWTAATGVSISEVDAFGGSFVSSGYPYSAAANNFKFYRIDFDYPSTPTEYVRVRGNTATTEGFIAVVETFAYEEESTGNVGTADATLAGLQASASGSMSFGGSAAADLPGLEVGATGALVLTGAAAAALPGLEALTLAPIDGTVEASAQGLEASAPGGLVYTAAAVGHLAALEAEADGTLANDGEAAGDIAWLAAAADGAQTITGTAAGSTAGLEVDAGGALTLPGTVAASPPALEASASGSLAFSGTVAATLPDLSALAISSIEGAAASMLAGLEALATSPIEGGAAAELAGLVAAAAGGMENAGAAAATLPGLEALASSSSDLPGTAAVALPGLEATAAGQVSIDGTVAGALSGLEVGAVGALALPGTIAGALPGLQAASGGSMAFAGTVAAELPPLVASATADGAGEIGGAASASLTTLEASAAGELLLAGGVDALSAGLEAVAGGGMELGGSAAAERPALAATGAWELHIDGAAGGALAGLEGFGTTEGFSISGSIASATGLLAAQAEGSVTITGQVDAALPALLGSTTTQTTIAGSAAGTLPGLIADASDAPPTPRPVRFESDAYPGFLAVGVTSAPYIASVEPIPGADSGYTDSAVMPRHADLTYLDGLHGIISGYIDDASDLAAGVVRDHIAPEGRPLIAGDVGKVYQRLDTGVWYGLLQVAPLAWWVIGEGTATSFPSTLSQDLDANGFRHVDVGAILPRIASISYASSVNVNVGASCDHVIAPLTGDIAIVLTNPVDGAQGTIELRQNGVGGHELTGITCAGRAVLMPDSPGTLQIAQEAGAISVFSYAVKADYVLVVPGTALVSASYGAPSSGGGGSGGPSLSSTEPPAIGNGGAGAASTAARGDHTHDLGGAVGGDLSGTLPNPTVARLQGIPVSTTDPVDGEVLKYSSSLGAWAPGADNNSGGGGGSSEFVTEALTFSNSLAIDFDGVDRFTLVLTGNCVISSLANVPERGCQLAVSHSGGPHTLTWPWDVQRPVSETLDPHAAGTTMYSIARIGSTLYAAKGAAFEANDDAPSGISGTAGAALPGLSAAASGAVGAFSPTDYGADLRLWLKARTADITLSGGDVSAWNDLSPAGNDAGPSSYGGLPLWNASDAAWDGHGSVNFDNTGVDPEAMDANAVAAGVVAGSGAFTVCVAVKQATNTTYQKVWGFSSDEGDSIGLGFDDGGRLTMANVDGDENLQYGFVAIDGTVPRIITCVVTPRVGVTPGTYTIYDSSTPLTLSENDNNAAAVFDYFTIGRLGAEALNGSIAEIVVIRQALDAGEVAELAAFVAADKF